MHCQKCQSKALKIAVGIPGVESVELAGKEKDQVVVIGDGIDSVELTRRLRKKVAHAELVSVGEPKKLEKSKSGSEHPPPWAFLPPPPYYNYCVVKEPAGDLCTIM
ncbi:hypothetical protein CASFOL_024511 [Castilleja foliolosa]|uniref:HMA domain-containing protein n=1 Tax=Castilleja foliolosa TaxID=1961234 RepID=A0ABD3CPI5_9LAMI